MKIITKVRDENIIHNNFDLDKKKLLLYLFVNKKISKKNKSRLKALLIAVTSLNFYTDEYDCSDDEEERA